ncbi:MAG: ferredoxin [Clostridia bacterium]|nr:ferredoxin [Clostridia bacterium]
MNVTIIEGCIACGLCYGTCPDVFRQQEDGTAEVFTQPDEHLEAAVKEAAEGCPVSVIVTGE